MGNQAKAVPAVNFLLQQQRAAVMMAQQWDQTIRLVKNCMYIVGFQYLGPDYIIINMSEKCPFWRFNERLKKMEVKHVS